MSSSYAPLINPAPLLIDCERCNLYSYQPAVYPDDHSEREAAPAAHERKKWEFSAFFQGLPGLCQLRASSDHRSATSPLRAG